MGWNILKENKKILKLGLQEKDTYMVFHNGMNFLKPVLIFEKNQSSAEMSIKNLKKKRCSKKNRKKNNKMFFFSNPKWGNLESTDFRYLNVKEF